MSPVANSLVDSTWVSGQSPDSGQPSTPGFSDGLGDRTITFDETSGTSLENLRFKPEFGDAASFEGALRERVEQLKALVHPAVAVIRTVERSEPGWELTLVSERVEGHRLSDLIPKARGPVFALELLQQITPVLATMQKSGVGVAHGAITPERIIFTDQGRLVVREHVLGSALQSLKLPASRLRSELGIVVPAGKDPVALDCRTDIIQIGFVALALVLGRGLDPADYPARVPTLIREFAATTIGKTSAGMRLRRWLERTLQLGARPFGSVYDAHDALLELPDEGEFQKPEPPQAQPAAPKAAEAATKPAQPAATAPPHKPATSVTPPIASRPANVPAAPSVAPTPIAPAPSTTPTLVSVPPPVTIPAAATSVVSRQPASTAPTATSLRQPEAAARPSERPMPDSGSAKSDTSTAAKPTETAGAPPAPTPQVRTLPPTVAPRLIDSANPAPVVGTSTKAAGPRPLTVHPSPRLEESSARRDTKPGDIATPLKPIDRNVPSPKPPSWATEAMQKDSARASRASIVQRLGSTFSTSSLVDEADEEPSGRRNLLTLGFAALAAIEAIVIIVLLMTRPSAPPRATTQASVAGAESSHPTEPTLPPPAPAPPPLVATVQSHEPAPVTPPPAAAAEPPPTRAEPPPLPLSSRFGGLRVNAPVELQVFEGGKLVGSTAGPVAMLEGTHELDLVNDALGYRVHHSVSVKAGQLGSLAITVPSGRVSINAVPWADVTIDGNPAGQTPLANLSLTIGTHEIVFKHPQFGEIRQTAVVKTDGLTKISANLQR